MPEPKVARDRYHVSLIAVCVMVAVAAASAFGVWWWLRPLRLDVALEASPSAATDILQRYAGLTARDGNNVILTVREVPDSAERLRLLDTRATDVAVFRLDEPLPANGAAIALVKGEAVLIAARANARVAKVPDLRQKRVGVVAAHANDAALLRQVIDAYRIDMQWVPLETDAAAREAFVQNRIDALAVVGRPDGGRVRALLANLAPVAGGAPVLLPIEASVVKSVLPHVEEATIAASIVDPRRSLPAEEVTTIAIDRVVMAARTRSNAEVASLTRLLFERRDQLAQRFPIMTALQPPSTDRGSSVPVHPGAAEYIDANEMNWFTRYSDYIWIGLCFTGVFGSLWGALYTRYRFSQEYGLTAVLSGIAEAGHRSRQATTLQELCALERDLTLLMLDAAQDPRLASDADAIDLMRFTSKAAWAAIKARRRELSNGHGRRALKVVGRSRTGADPTVKVV